MPARRQPNAYAMGGMRVGLVAACCLIALAGGAVANGASRRSAASAPHGVEAAVLHGASRELQSLSDHKYADADEVKLFANKIGCVMHAAGCGCMLAGACSLWGPRGCSFSICSHEIDFCSPTRESLATHNAPAPEGRSQTRGRLRVSMTAFELLMVLLTGVWTLGRCTAGAAR